MNDAMTSELSPQPRAEIPIANVLPTVDVVVSNASNEQPKEKGKQVKKKINA